MESTCDGTSLYLVSLLSYRSNLVRVRRNANKAIWGDSAGCADDDDDDSTVSISVVAGGGLT
eukprot:4634889-Ditylum_brightwellii.AAC.1